MSHERFKYENLFRKKFSDWFELAGVALWPTLRLFELATSENRRSSLKFILPLCEFVPFCLRAQMLFAVPINLLIISFIFSPVLFCSDVIGVLQSNPKGPRQSRSRLNGSNWHLPLLRCNDDYEYLELLLVCQHGEIGVVWQQRSSQG